uniref:K Homology domain-containing protein n=1 Tax=Romanomermis culicivorax TaxID=13658 RepID=A0A915J1V6_ROMCU
MFRFLEQFTLAHSNSSSNDSVKRPLSGDTENFSSIQDYNGNPPKRLNNHEDMSSGNPITALGASNFNPVSGMEPVVMEQFQVPDSCVGLIIGRGGENITNMQNETGCKIQMSQTYQDNNGKQMRGCSLTGTKLAIDKAKRCLESIIEKSGGTLPPMKNGSSSSMNNNMVSSPTSGMGGGPASMNFPGGGKMVTIEMQIPGTKCGLIIGKGGETIKQLQEKAQVKMVMIQENNQVTSGYKPLRIIGEPDKIEVAKRLVEEVMYSKDDKPPAFMNEYGSMAPKAGASMGEVIVPRSAVGVIIGKNGETIRRLTLESGAKIQFKPDTNAPERTAYIVGSADQIQRATEMITDLVNRAISQDQNGGMRMMRLLYVQGSEAADVFYMHVPANKTGLVIGKGGETIKQISAESGARVELSREPAPSDTEKVFVVRGTPYQIHHAQHLIRIKVGDLQPGTPVPPFTGSIPGIASEPQYNYPGFSQPAQPTGADQNAAWAAYYSQYYSANPATPYGGFPTSTASVGAPSAATPQQSTPASAAPAINPQTGQPDYSAQWADYYRSLGMHEQAALIEQQARANQAAAAAAVGQPAPAGAAAQQFNAYGQQQQSATPYTYGQPGATNAY